MIGLGGRWRYLCATALPFTHPQHTTYVRNSTKNNTNHSSFTNNVVLRRIVSTSAGLHLPCVSGLVLCSQRCISSSAAKTMKRTRDATKAPPATRRQRKEKVPAMREVEVGEEEEEKEHESAAATLPLPSIAHTVSARLHLPAGGVRYVLEQTRRGATLPFLARYRRDETCGMMEDQLRQVIDTGEEVAAVHRRRQFMLRSLAERHLLTDELRQHLEKLVHLSQLEDAWEPFKLKRSSLAARGREAGLATWAEHLLQREEPINLKELHAALHAVEDGERLLLAIVSEELQRCEVLRQGLLESYQRTGSITSSVVANARKKVAKDLDDRDFAKLQKHFTFYDKKSFGVQRVSSHIVLALARGEAKGVLKVDLDRHTRNGVYDFQRVVEQHFPGAALRLGRRPNNSKNSITARERELLRAGMDAAYAHLNKAVQTTIRRDLQKSAEREAIIVFAHNVEHMLLQRPMANARVLAMDPGLANGIKCVALDSDGSVLTYFTGNFLDEPKLRTTIAKLVEVKGLNKIVIGNGTASQRTTQLVADVLRQQTWADVEFAVVSEAGASVYSVSDIAKEEFPSLDAMYRGAISIGRRVLDPLSELVKIPVRSMGIGMYQHDLHEKELNKALHRVVESCVARVGVNAESSSRYVMEKVPGITKKLVDQIVLARHAEKLRSRDDLRRVPGMTEPMFQQIAGFFRFPNSAEPLDNTHLHPEMYEVVRHLLTRVARGEVCGSTSVPSNTSDTSTTNNNFHAAGAAVAALSEAEAAALAARVGCGLATLRLVADELQQPGLDPRASLPHAGYLRRTLLDAKQLQPGAELEGVVQSVTTFGSFVDVGLHDAVLVRGEEAMRWQPGILVRQIIFTGRDELGRLRVDYKGPTSSKGSIRDRLRLEWEDALEEEEGCTNTKRARELPTTATTTTSATAAQMKEVDEPAAKRVRQAEPCAPPPPPPPSSSSEEEELEEFAI